MLCQAVALKSDPARFPQGALREKLADRRAAIMTFEHAKARDLKDRYGASLRPTRLGAQERYAHGVVHMRAALDAAKLGSLASPSSCNKKGVAAFGLIVVATH